jgi:CO/xanthine dehydrogenase FAD-binding subunit
VDVLVPRSLEEAVARKAARPEALPIAGGTDLMVELNSWRVRPAAIIDLSHVPELKQRRTDSAGVFLGAGVTFAAILRDHSGIDLLAQAARTVGSPQIRARGTLGGNLGTASPAGDALPVLAVYGAEVVLRAEGRTLPWDEFLVGPKRTAIHADELIVATRWPSRRHVGLFSKVGPRNAMAIAVASLATVIDEEAKEVRVALGSVGPTVLRARDAEAYASDALRDAGLWEEPSAPLRPEVIEEFGVLVAGAARPIDDIRGTAAYRRHACRVLGTRALTWLLQQRLQAQAA